jgi:putative NADH-flavin reductase
VVVGDVRDADAAEQCCKGADVVVSMLTPLPTDPDFLRLHVECTAAVVAASKIGGVKRLVVIGGAGVMERSAKYGHIEEVDLRSKGKALRC